jgi:uncharacterized Zn finger protein
MPVAARGAAVPNILDRMTADVIHGAFPEEVLAAAREAVFAGRVSRPSLAPTRADAAVADGGRVVRARLFWSGDRLGSSCGCGDRRCAHAAALALLLLGEARPEKDGPAEPPPSQRDEERRRRQARGSSELFEIERRGGKGLYGDYQVSSPSSQAYLVTLRSLDAPHNGCSCPDFATNLLGTCKHVEAVLRHLGADAPRRSRRGRRRATCTSSSSRRRRSACASRPELGRPSGAWPLAISGRTGASRDRSPTPGGSWHARRSRSASRSPRR